MVRWQCVVPLSIFVHAQKLDVLLLWQELGRRVGEVLGTQQSTERSRGQVDRGTVRSKMRHICLSMPPDPVRLINTIAVVTVTVTVKTALRQRHADKRYLSSNE